MKICLTFDVEEFSIPSDYGVKSAHYNSTEFSRQGCMRILELLRKHDIKSTFFVTGYFAEREKETVKKISEDGHEVASHSYMDADISGLSKDELKERILRSKVILEKITGKKMRGFRTPHFKVNPSLVVVLDELGFIYDSSVHPAIVPGHYWNWNAMLDRYTPSRADIFKKGDSRIKEIPVSVIPLIRFPISWWWMRNLGGWVTCIGARINISQKRDIILYFHAWEFAEIPAIERIPFHMARNTGDVFLKMIDVFISKFKKYGFGRMGSLIK